MKNYLRALTFLTVLPLPRVPFDREGRALGEAASWFPLAGATLGLILALFARLMALILPPAVVAIAILAGAFVLTRGLHVDGLADTADGLVGTTGREEAFRAMEDSAIGAMGAAVLVFTVLFKLFLIMAARPFPPDSMLVAMFLAGRWSMVFCGVWFSPARRHGLGSLFLREISFSTFLKASLAAVLIIALLAWWRPQEALPLFVGSLAALAGAYLLSLYASRRLGGLSGDVLGATGELGELCFLAGFVALQSGLLSLPLEGGGGSG